MPNGRSRGKRRGRRPKRSKDEKGGRTVNTAAPALFAFMGPLSSSGSLSVWRWACAALRCGNGWFRNGQRKAIIRTHHRLEIGSDYIGLVRMTGLEPARAQCPLEPESSASASSATSAQRTVLDYHNPWAPNCQGIFSIFLFFVVFPTKSSCLFMATAYFVKRLAHATFSNGSVMVHVLKILYHQILHPKLHFPFHRMQCRPQPPRFLLRIFSGAVISQGNMRA